MGEHVLGEVDSMSSGSAQRFDIEGVRLAVARVDDTFYALADRCSHEDFSLSLGEVFIDTCEIECARHGATFDLLTGAAMCFPATVGVSVYPVKVVDGKIVVTLP